MYGSLGHEPLISIGVDAFVANDHVHELHDLTLGWSSNEHRVEEGLSTSSHPLPGIGEEAELSVSDEGDNQKEGSTSDDGMELTPRTRREVDEVLERQSKRARGLEADDKE